MTRMRDAWCHRVSKLSILSLLRQIVNGMCGKKSRQKVEWKEERIVRLCLPCAEALEKDRQRRGVARPKRRLKFATNCDTVVCLYGLDPAAKTQLSDCFA